MTRRKKCPRGECRPIRTTRAGVEVCETCGDQFPCGGLSGMCTHIDCADRRTELLERSGRSKPKTRVTSKVEAEPVKDAKNANATKKQLALPFGG